jgi:hypothetical protein
MLNFDTDDSKQNNKLLSFDDLSITTMTMVFILNGKVDVESAFHLLPITLIETKAKNSLKYKLPKHDIPGSIISMNFRGMTRGIIRNRKKFFKNSIGMDISTTLKNINLKLSPEKIQLCGAVSKENGIEAVKLVLQHLNHIKCYISQLNQLSYNNIVNNLSTWTGQEIKKHTIETIVNKDGTIYIHKDIDDYKIQPYDNLNLNNDLSHYIKSLTTDLTYHSDYMNKMRNLLCFKEVYQHDTMDISLINEVMVNYNYNLGFQVNRDMLNCLIDGKNGFISHYDNALVNNVTIELPYEEKYHYNKKKNKIPHHTFLVYCSGAVTQSGPNSYLMRIVFNLFMNTIHEIKDQIML